MKPNFKFKFIKKLKSACSLISCCSKNCYHQARSCITIGHENGNRRDSIKSTTALCQHDHDRHEDNIQERLDSNASDFVSTSKLSTSHPNLHRAISSNSNASRCQIDWQDRKGSFQSYQKKMIKRERHSFRYKYNKEMRSRFDVASLYS